MSVSSSNGFPTPEGQGTRPLVFGEVLFDHFPDRTVLGGAPFNVAWNLSGFELNPLMITAIGSDEEGTSVKEHMSHWGMDVQEVQVSQVHPTGRVEVSIRDGQPEYEIVRDQAYDFIEPPISLLPDAIADEFAILYHGSLVWRSQQTRETLQTLISTSRCPRFVDINIREPHFKEEWLEAILAGATWVKLNDDELSLLTGSAVETKDDVISGVDTMTHRYGPAMYFVTAGSRGAFAVESGQVHFQPAGKQPELRDTVGAGDAFAAMTIEGLLRKRDTNATLKRAVNFAARICGINGATSDNRSLYRKDAL